MSLRESEAIVLRTYPLGEGDRLVSLLDRQSGRVRGVARGARRTTSRFGSTLELLSYVRIWYFEREGRELVRINQCELIESFLDVQRDYAASTALALLSEVAESSLEEREPAAAQFRLILLAARAIRSNGPEPTVLAYFALWMARLGGWLGPLDRCSGCGRALDDAAAFHSSGRAELFCMACRSTWMKPVSKEALSIGCVALSGTLDQLLRDVPKRAASKEILSYGLDILEHHMEKQLASRRILETGEIAKIES